MADCAFSSASNERTAQPSSAMCRNNNQICCLLRSSLIDGCRAVSGSGKCIDRNPTEIDLLQKSLHSIVTPAPRCLHVNRQMVFAAAHHNRTEISDVHDDNARADAARAWKKYAIDSDQVSKIRPSPACALRRAFGSASDTDGPCAGDELFLMRFQVNDLLNPS